MSKNILYPLRRTIYWFLAEIDRLLDRENQAVILVFHAVDDGNWFFGNSVAQIEGYIKLLSKHYKFLTLTEMFEAIKGKKHHMEKIMAITFDDGYHNIMSIAPLMQKLGIRPTVFALSDPQNANRKVLETQNEFRINYAQ